MTTVFSDGGRRHLIAHLRYYTHVTTELEYCIRTSVATESGTLSFSDNCLTVCLIIKSAPDMV